MSYIFWKLLFQQLILAIKKHFLSILRGVRFLLIQWDASILHCVLSKALCRKCCLLLILLSSYQWKWKYSVCSMFVCLCHSFYIWSQHWKQKCFSRTPTWSYFHTTYTPTIIFQNLPQKYNLEMIQEICFMKASKQLILNNLFTDNLISHGSACVQQ